MIKLSLFKRAFYSVSLLVRGLLILVVDKASDRFE